MKLLTRIDRYMVGEILGPFGLGCAVYTLILFLHFLLQASEMIFARGVPMGDVVRLMLYYLPSMLVLVIPMAFLFAALMAVGRLASDSEITAMRASGISLLGMYRPLLAFSLLLTLANIALMSIVLPAANTAYTTTFYRIQTRHATQVVEPRAFHTDLGSWVMYVFGVTDDRREWDGVFLTQETGETDSEIMIAKRGHLVYDEETQEQILQLNEVRSHAIDLADSFADAQYRLGYLQTYEKVVESAAGIDGAERRQEKGLRSMTLRELREERGNENRSEAMRRMAAVELHKKFALPAACIGFGLFALPIAFSSQRGSGARSSSFAVSLLLIALYYILLERGEKAARLGDWPPWLAMWLPNLILLVLGTYFFWRRNRDRQLLLGGVDDVARRVPLGSWANGLRERLVQWRSRGSDQSWLQFPSRNDRYILRLFFAVATVTAASMLLLTILARFTRFVDQFQRSGMDVLDIWRYLGTVALDTAYLMTPVVVLIATVLTFTLLSRTNEVVAWRSTGVSQFRLAIPILVASAAIAAGTFLMDEYVLPQTNQKKEQLEDLMSGRQTQSIRRADQQWLFGQDRFIYHWSDYDPVTKTLRELEVFEFNREHEMTRRLYAAHATYQGEQKWIFDRGWTRSFAGGEVVSFQWFEDPRSAQFPETPDYFEDEERHPAEMTLGELRRTVSNLERGGQPDPVFRAHLHRKIAYPAGCLAMALVALPFSFRVGRQGGALYGVGLALGLAIAFIVLDSIFSTLGETGTLPAVLAAWAPTILFSTLAVYLFLGVRS